MFNKLFNTAQKRLNGLKETEHECTAFNIPQIQIRLNTYGIIIHFFMPACR